MEEEDRGCPIRIFSFFETSALPRVFQHKYAISEPRAEDRCAGGVSRDFGKKGEHM